jgi:Tfp pilus assembly protein PilX
MKTQSLKTVRRAQAGSAILGVLVATVFLGIVVGSMVRSTGSQSSASRSYGNKYVATSTVNSAMIATETFLASQQNESLRSIIQNAATDTAAAFTKRNLTGTTQGNKVSVPGANSQFYSSALTRIYRDGNNVNSAIEVKSGTEAGGRDLGQAVMFANLGELGASVGGWGDNALYSAKTGNFGNENVRYDINGNVNITGNFRISQNSRFNGATRVGGELRLGGSATGNFVGGVTAEGGIREGENRITNGKPGEVIPGNTEPHLDMTKIPASVTRLGKADITVPGQNPGEVTNTFDYDRFRAAVAAVPQEQRYNGHVVIALNNFGQLAMSVPNTAEEFDGKVIFVLSGSGAIECGNHNDRGFYRSAPGSNTMIYLGGSTRINEFGSPGVFRGYVHVPQSNNQTQGFRPRPGSEFVGAIHVLGNSHIQMGDNVDMKITYDRALLDPLSGLFCDTQNTGGTGGGQLVLNPYGGINFRALGYYYY